MRQSYLSFRDIWAAIRRRKWLLIVPTLVLTGAGVVAAMLATRMYESSTTILIQRTEVINPLASLANAMTQVDDPLRSFDQIVYSQRMINQLIEGLGLDSTVHSELERRLLFSQVQSNIQTRIQSRESFSITYYDTYPERAQRGASLLASLFIKTVTDARERRNEMTVEFYEKKLEEFRQKFEVSQKELVEKLKARKQDVPEVAVNLSSRLETIQTQMDAAANRERELSVRLATLNTYPEALGTPKGREALYELPRASIPYADELKPVLVRHEDLIKRYTNEHPDVVAVEAEVVRIIERMKVAVGTELRQQNRTISDLRKSKNDVVEAMMESSVLAETERGNESNVAIYQRLYNEMKVKLEEAEMTRAIGEYAEAAYTILDYPLVPLFPSRPSRVAIIGGALALGLLLGILSGVIAEIIDTTIRSPRQIESYRKPIIALLPEGTRTAKHD